MPTRRDQIDGRLGDAVGQHRVEVGVGRRPGDQALMLAAARSAAPGLGSTSAVIATCAARGSSAGR